MGIRNSKDRVRTCKPATLKYTKSTIGCKHKNHALKDAANEIRLCIDCGAEFFFVS